MAKGRVLVTGSSGFVGRYTLPALIDQGFEVHAVSRRRMTDAPTEVVQHHADMLDPTAAASLIERVRPSHLLHLAWTVTPGHFWRAPDNLDWVAASLLLYRAFAQSGGRRILMVGTCAEYDWDYNFLDEFKTPCRPATLYGIAKYTLYQLLSAAAKQDRIELAWGRLFFLYGPNEAQARLVPDVALSLLRGKPALCGDGEARRDFMAVEDVAGALVAVLASEHVGPVNIASGQCIPIRDVILTIADLIGRPDLVRLGARPAAPGDPAKLAANVTILTEAIGYKSRFTLQEGLAATVAWWRNQEQGQLRHNE